MILKKKPGATINLLETDPLIVNFLKLFTSLSPMPKSEKRVGKTTSKPLTMKKLNFLAILFFAFLTFSCDEDQKDQVTPQQQTRQEDYKPANSNVPHFNEANSTKMSWSQLPNELRNAKPIETKKSTPNAREQVAFYSFFYGPFGGDGGEAFYIYPPNGSQLYAMAIRSGSLIDKLIIWYRTSDGTIYSAGAGGEGGGYNLQYFAADEHIYFIAGRSGGYLDRLSIYTNKKSFTYGGEGGRPFYAQVPPGYQILGFWGRSGGYVDQIGFYAYTI